MKLRKFITIFALLAGMMYWAISIEFSFALSHWPSMILLGFFAFIALIALPVSAAMATGGD